MPSAMRVPSLSESEQLQHFRHALLRLALKEAEKAQLALNSPMGLMNVLKFSAACFDLLGWPLFALGYPLCASIRAIETNSISDVRKLVAYWVLFSLISLFDHTFAKLLEW
ncbi:HVA22-like protein c [Vitis vinifera]|uniref:HVA22-like protein n=1 Tax=Vitis vinifera TaxID=29760 RepID=A0A438I775_VITVI|nr:HVA22-like protein c [Vitis vinifera]